MTARPTQDDFSLATEVIDAERRLHLRAFDYWHHLKTENIYPLFSDLRADDLAPFKANCLLLEFNARGTIVRFIGDRLSLLIDAPIAIGHALADFPQSAFARALVSQFATNTGRAEAAEFEFAEDHVACRGMMLPFSSDGIDPNFVMVVSNFRRREVANIPPPAPVGDLAHMVAEARRTAQAVGHLDSNGRSGLYEVLARSLALFEAAATSPEYYETFLAENGLKHQKRAPFTPVLKLVFGKKYDKTRLTEYAAALACAVREGMDSTYLAQFLEDTPGGIKGCVQLERAFRRGTVGTSAHALQQDAVRAARKLRPAPLASLDITDDFSLVLVRKSKKGKIDILGTAPASNSAVAAAIRGVVSSRKK